MRVLLISHTCQSITEGQPKAQALAAFGDVTLRVLVPDRWRQYGKWRRAQPPTNAGFEFEVARPRFPWAGPAQNYLHYYPTLGRTIREFGPDVIDVWEEPWGMVSAQACRLRNRIFPRAKIVSETEQNINKRLPFPFERLRVYTMRNADFAVGRSAEAVEVLRSKGYAGAAEVVPNAVDEKLFCPMDRERCRGQLNFSGFVVGYVGRFVEAKGLLDLIAAVGLCPAEVNLALAGSGPLEQRLGREARVRLLGAMAPRELAQAMNAMDLLVLPSRTTPRWKEQFGRVLIEAQACGTPVIGTDSGAIADVVGEGGLVVPERNPGQLAEAIMQLRDDPDRCRRLGQAGRNRVLERYTWQSVAQRMHDIYQRVLLQKPLLAAA
jgi:glycosyltransferase involved in cell wall biosynthesis